MRRDFVDILVSMTPVKSKRVRNRKEEVIETTHDQVDPRIRLRGAGEALESVEQP